jgi:hypothetical protein
MKKITVTVSGLSPFEMEVGYQPQKSELDNILRALICAAMLVSKEAAKCGDELDVKFCSCIQPIFEAKT